MPIRKSQRRRYPPHWRSISEYIRFGRAGGKCECQGDCGSPHGGRCSAPHGAVILRDDDAPHRWRSPSMADCAALAAGESVGARTVGVVLTVAHLDHTPEHCADENLLAMCQLCHLRYDKHHHQRTRRASRADRDMWEGTG